MVFRRILYGLAIALLPALPPPGAAHAQGRPPELNTQFHRAETAWRSGASMLEAKARIDRVLTALPDDVAALKLRARVLLEMERPAEALRDARRAARLQPEDSEAHLIRCEAARLTGDLGEAGAALDAAARIAGDDPGLHVHLSWNAVLLGRLDEAEAFARIALAAEPDDAAGRYQLARVFILKEQPDAAVTLLADGLRAAVLDPAVVRTDTVLVRVAAHPELQNLLDR
ncbi:MAG: tetratricopeptide repeat protein [Rhodothermales bacterium]|nr:tetratricopeptide repeat protein [Rhodothermales bacterium]